LAIDKKRSSSVVWSTPRAYVSAVACGLPWRCTTPFGSPVVPELYSQNAGDSLVVAATRRRRPVVEVVPRVDWHADVTARAGDHDGVLDACRRRRDPAEVVGERRRHDEGPGACVGDDRGEVVGGEHRRDRHRHDPGAQRTEEPRREGRLVVDDEDDAVALTDAEIGERVLGAEHVRLHVGIRE
jgi:hypothetical protein